jgi:DNA-binding XRE family transcriptional regulator
VADMARPEPPFLPIAKAHTDAALLVSASAIGMTVSAARNRLGLSQAALGKKVGLTQRSISFIETGKPVTGVSDAKIEALFTALPDHSPSGRQAGL